MGAIISVDQYFSGSLVVSGSNFSIPKPSPNIINSSNTGGFQIKADSLNAVPVFVHSVDTTPANGFPLDKSEKIDLNVINLYNVYFSTLSSSATIYWRKI